MLQIIRLSNSYPFLGVSLVPTKAPHPWCVSSRKAPPVSHTPTPRPFTPRPSTTNCGRHQPQDIKHIYIYNILYAEQIPQRSSKTSSIGPMLLLLLLLLLFIHQTTHVWTTCLHMLTPYQWLTKHAAYTRRIWLRTTHHPSDLAPDPGE